MKNVNETLQEKYRQGLVDVQSLGKQTKNEISDPVYEDETEAHEQSDLKNIQNKRTQEK